MATPTTLPATFVAGNVLTAAQMNDLRGAFRVLQVVQTTKTDVFTTTSTTYTDITGMSVSITPSATSSKVLLLATFAARATSNSVAQVLFVRDSTPIARGDAAGNRTRATSTVFSYTPSSFVYPLHWLDDPATTSATTYKIQVQISGGTFGLNSSGDDTDVAANGRGVATLTAMEISL